MSGADPRVAAIVLAAGQGTRFAAQADGEFKLLARLEGAPLVRHVVGMALDSRARPIIVVTGHRRDDVIDALGGLAFEEARNHAYASGLASSLAAGLAALPADVAGAIVLLGDMPRVSARLVDALIAAFAKRPDCDAVAPVHRGRRGNPVLLARSLFDAAQKLTGDEGARRLLTSADVVEMAVEDAGVTIDVDTPASLHALRG